MINVNNYSNSLTDIYSTPEAPEAPDENISQQIVQNLTTTQYGDAVQITLSAEAQEAQNQAATTQADSGEIVINSKEVVYINGTRPQTRPVKDALDGLDPYAEMEEIVKQINEQNEADEAEDLLKYQDIGLKQNQNSEPKSWTYVDKNGHTHLVRNKAQVLKDINKIQAALDVVGYGSFIKNGVDLKAAIADSLGHNISAKMSFLSYLDKNVGGLAITFTATSLSIMLEHEEDKIQSKPEDWVDDLDYTDAIQDDLDEFMKDYEKWNKGNPIEDGPD